MRGGQFSHRRFDASTRNPFFTFEPDQPVPVVPVFIASIMFSALLTGGFVLISVISGASL